MSDRTPWVAPGGGPGGPPAPPPPAPGSVTPPPTDVPFGAWAYPAPPPPPPIPPRRSRTGRIIAAVVGVIAVLGLVAALVAVIAVRDGNNISDGSGNDGADTAGGELDAVVADISAFVEDERGLEFLEPVDVELADDDEFEQRLLEDFDEERDELEETEVVLRGLGFIDAETDLAEALESSLAAGVVGFYDPTTDELVVRGTDTTPYVRTTIAHELTHALDDQHFELDRPAIDESDGEEGFGFDAVVEGSAVRVQEEYLATFSDREREQYLAEEAELASSFPAFSVPPVVLELLVAPYTLGPALVAHVIDEDGEDGLDAAFEEPPITSEQVMVPEKFTAGEEPVAVQAPAADGEIRSEGSFGAFLLTLLLEEELGPSDVDEAVTGWGGDAYVAWEQVGNACVRLSVVGDSVQDTAELAAALDEWAEEDGGSRTSTQAGAGPVTLERCA